MSPGAHGSTGNLDGQSSNPGVQTRLAAVVLLTAVLAAAAVGLVTSKTPRTAVPAVARRAVRTAVPGAAGAPNLPPAALVPGRRSGPASGARATLTLGAPVLRVPRSYFGLSTEYWAMPLLERHMAQFKRILDLFHWPGDEPLVLRIGGDSTDHALFDVNVGRLPRALFELTPQWFRQTGQVVDQVSARVILDLNLVDDLPRMAVQWARAAQTELPPGSIVAYEIGNEPDLYNPLYWSHLLSPLERVLDIRLFTSGLTPGIYDDLYAQYAQALATFAPHVPLAAPVVAYPTIDFDWLDSFLARPQRGLAMVTAHMYPYSACALPGQPEYPSVAKLLSENATAGMAASLVPAINLAHRAGLPFRLTEVNSVTCGGVPGVSDTFATALWAPDALFELLRRGVNGVNVHVRAYAVNAAFALGPGGIAVHPLLYGLVLFARTLGPDAELVQTHLRVGAGVHLKAWVVRVAGNILHVLLIDKGSRGVRVDLSLPAVRRATVERLLAPTPTARSGVSLDGQRLGAGDTWQGRAATQSIGPGRVGYELNVPRYSAALLSVPLAS